jgi:1-acyl-sn-glycerol-3-phosphate acyltransferase
MGKGKRFIRRLLSFPLALWDKPKKLPEHSPLPEGPLVFYGKALSRKELSLLRLAFLCRNPHPVYPEEDSSAHPECPKKMKPLFLSDKDFENKATSLIKENESFYFSDSEEARSFAGKQGLPCVALSLLVRHFHRSLVIALLSPSREKTDLEKTLYHAERRALAYRESGDYAKVSPRYLLIDLCHLLLLVPYAFLYPTHYLYESEAAKKSRRFSKAGIILSNHISLRDPEQLARTFRHRRIHVLCGTNIYDRGPVMRFCLKHALCVRSKQGSEPGYSGSLTILNSLRVLDTDSALALFPEGTLCPDGIGALHLGAAYLALESGAKIYPAVTLRPYRLFRFQAVIVGDPIDPKDFGTIEDRVSRESALAFTAVLEAKMKDLREEGLRRLRKNTKKDKSHKG